MKIAKTLRAIADIIEEPVDSQEDKLYPQKRLIFYQVLLEKQLSLRFAINTALISISTAFLALLPTIADHLFRQRIPIILQPLVTEALICFVSLIILCLVMYELDFQQLQRLDKSNNEENADTKFIPNITFTLLVVQYILLIFGVILTGIIFYCGVFYV